MPPKTYMSISRTPKQSNMETKRNYTLFSVVTPSFTFNTSTRANAEKIFREQYGYAVLYGIIDAKIGNEPGNRDELARK